jgi:hypothetical protein
MDLSRKSVRTILIRLHRVLPGHIMETADRVGRTFDSQLAVGKGCGEWDREGEGISPELPSTGDRIHLLSATAGKWDDDDGAEVRQSGG